MCTRVVIIIARVRGCIAFGSVWVYARCARKKVKGFE